MPQLIQNNTLVYYAPLYTLGGQNDDTAAVGVMSKFDFVVIQPHVLVDQPRMLEILQAYQIMNPRGKVYGYTDLGGSVNYAAWQAQVDAWTTAITPTAVSTIVAPPLLAGIYIDNFGFDFAPLVTRDIQNQAITYLRTGPLLPTPIVTTYSAMVAPTMVFDAFDKLGANLAAVFGTSPAIRDYVLLDNFFFKNTNTTGTLTAETPEHQAGRLTYAKDVVLTKILGNSGAYNTGFIAMVGAGNNTNMLQADYLTAIALANSNRCEGFGVTPFDRGLTSQRYFESFTGNQFS